MSEGGGIKVQEAVTEGETRALFSVIRELRPHLSEGDFLAAADRMRGEGYRLAGAYRVGGPVGAAGFRVFEALYSGRQLYVDDLVVAESERSGGVGRAMLGWLEAEARRAGCAQLHLDSGVQRAEAHRFYFRERMSVTSFHFAKHL
ncbi:Acetyltransferase (GNAT) family [Rubrobacter radiotolerans]|uniref:Acetyltransferase (GNAT) family n=1 Tax=Rubrobacter radiotolerans TaxID=42256 RepID=A0A023X2Z1_RUBRA|nr:GNAT family N-acetyltransferase [Rubrobacter radiotolerans]AHY46375.1 Acetyltransferase (GNAT) family [Rubrobacter radiotolerans]MDX5893782.1 GNAT family N-acetyltransferase [Rubrobacter radiotolerans]SMC04495.1 Acetyltransferase (GNAT) family protein [Rubrobacter radiotolerans DSM 5868]